MTTTFLLVLKTNNPRRGCQVLLYKDTDRSWRSKDETDGGWMESCIMGVVGCSLSRRGLKTHACLTKHKHLWQDVVSVIFVHILLITSLHFWTFKTIMLTYRTVKGTLHRFWPLVALWSSVLISQLRLCLRLAHVCGQKAKLIFERHVDFDYISRYQMAADHWVQFWSEVFASSLSPSACSWVSVGCLWVSSSRGVLELLSL